VPAFSGSAAICASLPVTDTELLPASLIDSTVFLCGVAENGALAILVSDQLEPSMSEVHFAVLYDGPLGYRADIVGPDVPGPAAAPNFSLLHAAPQNGLGIVDGERAQFCVDAGVSGSDANEDVQVAGIVDGCVSVVARSDTAITLRTPGDPDSFVFRLTAESALSPEIVPGFVGNS
jgi:hypothetical protein